MLTAMTRADEAWRDIRRPRSVMGWRSGRRLRVGELFTTPHIQTTWRVVRVRQQVCGRSGCRNFRTGSYDITMEARHGA